MAKRIQRAGPRPSGAARPQAAAAPGGGRGKRRRGRIPAQMVTEFTTQLATLSEAGIPIVKSLTILEGQTRAGPFKDVLRDLVDDVSGGTSLSDAMAKHEKVFDRMFSSMVRAGEAGGVLDRILNRLAVFRERAAEVRARIKGAMTYPLVIVLVAVAVVTAVIVKVIPKFSEIFQSFGTGLPDMTQFLLDVSDFVVGWWPVVFGVPTLAIIGHFLLLRRRGGRYRRSMHALQLKIPILGTLQSKTLIASFARTFGTLIEAGVPHLDALTIVRDTTSNDILLEGVEGIRRTVREGEGIARPMGESGLFDDLVVNMVDVGEATGELDSMLLKVADAYEVQVNRRIEALFKLLEPMLLILVAIFVGFIIVALFLPLLDIMSTLGDY